MYTPIVRGRDDDEAYFGEATAFKDGDFIISDAFQVLCNASDGSLYKNTHSSIMLNTEIKRHQGHKTLSSTAMDLNIVIFGFDSLSQMTWLRALPKTHSYFTQELGGLVFQRYNVVGYNTRTALLAMLTGHKFSELPEVTRGIQGARYVDDFPWLFRDFQHAGYVTQWGEDGCHYGEFNKVPRGFKYQPVDHYLRPFCMKIPRASITNMQYFCLGSQPRHTVMIQSILDLFNNYETKPKFSFMFMGDYSSDINNIVNLVDADVVSFLQEMNQRNWLNNTLLILMSDHGERYGELRAITQGRGEQRRPYLGLRFPDWFYQQYPDISDNLRRNTDRLITLFDVHDTLIEMLNNTLHASDTSHARGISMFHEVPAARTCDEAGIDPEWCSCIDWQRIPTDHYMVLNAASKFIKVLNSYTRKVREQCHILKLAEIINAYMYPNYRITSRNPRLEYQRNHTEVTLYHIEIKVHPSGGLYGTTARLDAKSGRFIIRRNEIDRNDNYGNKPACIEPSHPDLREYCYCRS